MSKKYLKEKQHKKEKIKDLKEYTEDKEKFINLVLHTFKAAEKRAEDEGIVFTKELSYGMTYKALEGLYRRTDIKKPSRKKVYSVLDEYTETRITDSFSA